jgi:hypothetical protein
MAPVLSDRPAAASQPAEEPRIGLLGDLLDELRWTLSSRKGWLFGILGNLAIGLIYVGFTHYDPHRSGDIRIANVGVIVVVWTLSDVVNTNQLGSDGDRVVASLEDRDSVARILAIKNLSLALLLVPLALLISVVLRILVGRWHLFPHTALTDVGAVFLWLGVGSVISVLLPYRPISLRARFRARSTWRRWALCQAAPYAAVGIVVPLLHLPYLALYHFHLLGRYSEYFVYYSLVYLVIALGIWLLGLWLASRYADAARSRLIADLRRGA